MAGAQRKKWSKERSTSKLDNAVLFDKATYDKAVVDIPKMKMITPAIVADRYKINASLARAVIRSLAAKGAIRPVFTHNALSVYAPK